MPYKYLETLYAVSKKQDLTQSILEALFVEKNKCLDDISKIKLPEKMCPFGCKKDSCPEYDYDASKCPHNLDNKDLGELGEYLVKLLYLKDKDEDDSGTDEVKKVPDEVIKAFMEYNRPGNYQKADKWQNK